MTIQAGSTDQYATVQIMNTDGTAKTDVTSATSGLSIKYQLDNGTVVTLTPVAMSAGGAHADGGIYHVDGGRYKIGLPDAAVSSVGKLCVWTTLTDTEFVEDEIAVVAYDPATANLGLNNVSPSDVQNSCNAAMVALYLDRLFAVNYAPESKPGAPTALLNELIVNEGGVSIFSKVQTVDDLTNANDLDESQTTAACAAAITAENVASTGDAMTLTAGERTSLAAALEAAVINELDGTAVMQAIADLIASDMTTGDLSVQAIAAATRDLILDRVLAGNHDTAGTVGKQLQDLPLLTWQQSIAGITGGTQAGAILDTLKTDLENLDVEDSCLAAIQSEGVLTTGSTVSANMIQINGHSIAGTGNQVADGFEFLFNVAIPTKTMEDIGTGVGGSGDWTATEKNQIRHRLGVDGTTATPATNTPNLDIPANLGAIVADWTDGGRLDLILDATATNTDDILSDLDNKPTAQETLTSFKADATFVSLFSDASNAATSSAANTTALAAVQASIDGLTTGITSRIRVATAAQYEHPESGTVEYKVVLLCVNESGVAVAPDSAPTLTAVNPSGTDRSGNLSALTNPSVGRYESIYTVTNGDALEQLIMTASATISAQTYSAVVNPTVTDAVATDFTATDRNTLNSLVSDIWSNGTRSLTDPVAANLTQILGSAIPAESAAGRMATAIQTLLDVVAPFAMTDLARQGADGDTLKTLSDQLDAVTTGTSPTQLLDTTIGTVTSQTVLILNAGAPDDDVYNGALAIVTDQADASQKAFATVTDYDSATNTITLAAAPGFTVAAGDNVKIVAGATGEGGSCDENAIATEIASQLASVPIKLLSPYSTNSKRLELVQDADYQSTGASQSIDFEITQPGIIAGDAAYFGAKLATNNSTIGPITGTVIDDAGTLQVRIEIPDTELAGKTPSENWLFTVVHRKDGITTPLIASSPMTLKENQVGMIL